MGAADGGAQLVVAQDDLPGSGTRNEVNKGCVDLSCPLG